MKLTNGSGAAAKALAHGLGRATGLQPGQCAGAPGPGEKTHNLGTIAERLGPIGDPDGLETRCEARLLDGRRCKREGQLTRLEGRIVCYCFVHRRLLREEARLRARAATAAEQGAEPATLSMAEVIGIRIPKT